MMEMRRPTRRTAMRLLGRGMLVAAMVPLMPAACAKRETEGEDGRDPTTNTDGGY